ALSPAPTEIDGKKMYEDETEVSLSASGNAIISFTNWSDGQTNSDIKVTMNEDKTLTANYSAKDFIAGWDFYKAGGNGRVADFYGNDENKTSALILTDEEGNTQGWLDKSTMAAGGYETMKGAAVNWKPLGKYYYQTKVNAKDFTDIRIKSQLLCNYNAYSHIVLQYSTDGTECKDAGETNLEKTKTIYNLDAALPTECDHAENLYIRWKPDLSSSVTGSTALDNDGTAISNIFILAEAAIFDDGKAPELTNTIPVQGATNASATGRIVLTFDKKIQLTENAKGTLNGEELELSVSGKTVLAQYKGLNYSTEYNFVLSAGSIVDLSGNNILNEEITLTFSTMTKPVVTKTLYDFIVPTDGTFKEALAAAEARSDNSKRYRIFVMQGDYIIPSDESKPVTGTDGNTYPDPKTSFGSPNVSIIGEGMNNTSIANTLPTNLVSTQYGPANPLEGIRTSGLLYLTSGATDMYFEDITLKTNTPDATGRNVILVDGGNRTICKDVCLWAYQDTYVSDRTSSTYYFEGGLIRGRTDFLCGSGDVFYNGVTLQMCEKGGYIAVPRSNVKYGYVFKDCTIKGEKDDVNGNYYLGRPWTEAAEAYYINTKMEAVPSSIGWANMSEGGCTRMAEYNSTTANGSLIDLDSRAKALGTGTNNPVLTAEEAEEIGNMHNMFGDWDPTLYTEQAAAPTGVVLYTDIKVLSWDNNDYALLWAVCKNGKVVDFTTEPTYAVDDVSATWSVRAANEMGGLGEATTAYITTNITELKQNAEVKNVDFYNLQGVKVGKSYKGTVIRVQTLEDGSKTVTKHNK
ncbi:MAG: pectinesterase family protein, partial [Prevotella sp.]